jgi:hypothetical protein
LQSPGTRKKHGGFCREISCRGRILWKSRLLFYSLPADFQQVFAAAHPSGQESLPPR